MAAQDNRREYGRLPKQFRVEYSAFEFPLAAQPKCEVCCADISVGGVRIETTELLKPESRVVVKIFLPSFGKHHPGFLKVFESDVGQYMQAISEVMWTESDGDGKYYAGLRFLDVDENDWRALESLIRKYERESE
jgi:c-di-GMP-binding flagellar brake protein YcgR